MNIIIHNENLHVTISTKGAELQGVKFKDSERLWQGDPNFWHGRAPVLFPMAGALNEGRYKFEGGQYEMPFHGFARNMEFRPVDLDEDKALFEISENEDTKKFYPFNFTFQVEYKVEGDSLFVTYRIINNGNSKMWLSFGAHESYVTNGNIEDYSLEFEKDEVFNSLAVAQGKSVLSHNKDEFGSGRVLKLGKDKFVHGTIILADLNSRKVNLLEKGKKIASLSYDVKNILCWTVENGKFLCIEPWNTCPDYEDFYGDIANKDGIVILEKGKEFSSLHKITYFD